MAKKKKLSKSKKTAISNKQLEGVSKTNNYKNKKEKRDEYSERHPILSIAIKSIVMILLICVFISFSDSKGYFDPDQSNNHTQKKWNAFYDFTIDNNVDILLMGNSHLYTGINPKNLSATLGVNSFILASPGTNISDTYFGLKEALKRTEPQLVVIETYGISSFNPYELKGGSLSDQFKSFYARKNILTKVISTPSLFNTENYGYAWSNTLRNHDFLFKDVEQLEKNKEIRKEKAKKKKEEEKKLYLGRYVRFQTGIEKDVLERYKLEGAPVNGEDYKYNSYTEKYVDKIVELCKNKNIELVFLTLPNYEKHIENYGIWKSKLNEVIGKDTVNWIDLQDSYDSKRFTTKSFENTYKVNQHMTYNGSMIATYKLANYIKTELEIVFPDRKADTTWVDLFYGEEGYFENHVVRKNDKKNTIIATNIRSANFIVSEVNLIKPEKGENKILMAKMDKSYLKNVSPDRCTLRLTMTYIDNNVEKNAYVDLAYDIFHEKDDVAIFKVLLKPLNVIGIKSATIQCR